MYVNPSSFGVRLFQRMNSSTPSSYVHNLITDVVVSARSLMVPFTIIVSFTVILIVKFYNIGSSGSGGRLSLPIGRLLSLPMGRLLSLRMGGVVSLRMGVLSLRTGVV